MESKKNLIEIIETKRLSIKNNPFGITRLWPNSYIELFYNEYCKKLFKYEKSPLILEVNQLNNLNLEIWFSFFDNPKIKNISIDKFINNEFDSSLKYDMIIIDNKYLGIDQKLITKLINLLKSKGIIIVENIGMHNKRVIKIFLNYAMNFKVDIFDYRLDRIIKNNCILIIRKRINKFDIIKFLKSLLLLLKFLSTELIFSILKMTFRN